MALRCPECEANALRVETAIELGSDARSDEVALQIVNCTRCGMEAVAVYEESRRGALDDDSVDHRAYPTDREALAAVRAIIASCPSPRDPNCGCRGHQRAREMLRGGTEPAGLDWSRRLPIVYVRS